MKASRDIIFIIAASVVLVLSIQAQATTLTVAQVAQAAWGAGFSGGALVNAIAIADAESGFVLEAHCVNCAGVTEDSCGLWQINIDVHSGYNESQLLSSASYNATAAYQISDASVDADWLPWSTFTGGNFISYLTIARNAAQNIDSTVIRGDNDTVSATTSLSVHPSAGSASSTRAVSAGATGTVIDGPLVSVIGTGTYIFVWWKIHWNDEGADGWSVEDYMIRTGTSQPTVAISFATSPADLQVTVDGTTYTTPTTLNWAPGSQHSLSVPTPQYFGLYSRYQFSGTQNQTITTPSSSPSNPLTAIFSTQYDLTLGAGMGGNVSSSSGWYDSGTIVQISATANSGYNFSSWTGSGTGSYSGSSSSPSVTMNAPIFETANFTANPTTYTITASAGSGGSVSPNGSFSKNAGDNQIFAATPNGNYTVNQWLLDSGVVQTGGTSYSLNNIQSAHSVQVTFTQASSPMISNPKLTGTTFTLSVPTQVGLNYTLEYKNSFSDANWMVVQTIGGTGGTIVLTDTGAIGKSRLYHVHVQ